MGVLDSGPSRGFHRSDVELRGSGDQRLWMLSWGGVGVSVRPKCSRSRRLEVKSWSEGPVSRPNFGLHLCPVCNMPRLLSSDFKFLVCLKFAPLLGLPCLACWQQFGIWAPFMFSSFRLSAQLIKVDVTPNWLSLEKLWAQNWVHVGHS